MASTLVTSRREIPNEFRRRLGFALALIIALFGLTFVRLWHLQVSAGDEYRSLSEHNRIRLKRVGRRDRASLAGWPIQPR